jgi:predicted protein tyrosine phosphatase
MLHAVAVPRSAVVDGEIQGDALVSIRGPEDPPLPSYALVGRFSLGVIELVFDDVPVPRHRTYLGPGLSDVVSAIEFGRRVSSVKGDARIVVHCAQGKSRSPAVALALMADAYGPGNEQQAVADFIARRDRLAVTMPNPGVVALAESHLGIGTALHDAVAARSPEYVRWVATWEKGLHGTPWRPAPPAGRSPS